MTAELSPCRTWRYVLTRATGAGSGTVAIVGLNPSTADEDVDDPTTRRCIRFARDWGFAGLQLVNLFALRATRPRELRRAADPVGPENAAALERVVRAADLVVCAWGNLGIGERAEDVRALVSHPHCLGHTRLGAPRHPLYVAAGTLPRPLC